MSGLLNKAKNALQGEKNTPEAAAANRGKNEYGHDTHATGHSHGGTTLPTGLEGDRKGSQLPGIQRGEHVGGTEASTLGPATGSGSATDSVAHSSHMSPTNPGVLHSTKPGIHGARDSGTATSLASSGDDSRLTGTTWGTHAGKGHDESVVTSSHISPTNPGVLDSTQPGIHGLRDSGTAHPTTTGSTGTTGTSGLTGTSGTTYPPTATGHETGGLTGTEKGLTGAGAGAGAVGVAEHEKHKHEHGHHSKDKGVTPVAAKHEHDHHKDSTASEGEKKHGFLGELLHRDKKPSHDETATHAATHKDTPTHGTSGLTSSTQPTTTGQTGTGLAGTGSGYEGNNRDRGIVDSGAVAGTGLAGAGVGAAAAHHHHNKEAEKDRLGGTTGFTGGIPSDGRHQQGTSGLGSDYNQTGSGLTGTSSSTPYDSSNRQAGSGLGAGVGAVGSVQGSGSTTTGQHGYGSNTTAGPHDSSLANKADPRVDSDLDSSRSNRQPGTGLTGAGATGAGLGAAGSGLGSGLGLGSTTTGQHGHGSNTTAGPHDSNLANKADPRVDSDLDSSRSNRQPGTGLTGAGATGAGLGAAGSGLGSGLGSGSTTTGQHGYGSNTTAGPHNSNLANKADPRVDSDLDSSRSNRQPGTGLTGAGATGVGIGAAGSGLGSGSSTGQHGYGTNTTTAGPHDSNLANRADPRVDSDLDRSRGLGSSTTNTTGMGSGVGSGMGSGVGSGMGSSGLTEAEKAEQYIEGSEHHHPGDGHPEDILHPGHHVTETAKQLDPHMG